MLKKPLVSICIPTFNRCEYLKKTLDSMIIQPEFLDGRVEVVICDNASEDNTPAVGAKYSRNYPNIHYYRNSENIRDRNFPMVLSKANGTFRRLNNDTYLLDNGTLANFCALVEKYRETKPQIFFTDANRIISDQVVIPFNEAIVKAGYMVTWLGGFSIWEDDCDGIEKDTDACKLQLWQVNKAYELGFKKGACVIYNARIGKTQQVKKKNMSYGIHKIFYKNYLSLLKPYVNNESITIQEYELIRKDLLYNFFTSIMIDWELQREKVNYSDKENLKKIIFNEYQDEPYWNEYLSFYNKKVRRRKFKLFFRKLFGNE